MSTETAPAPQFVKLQHNIFLDGEKVASFLDDGTLRMARGQSEIKPDLMLWLATQGELSTAAAEQEEEAPAEDEPATEETPEPVAEVTKPKKGSIPPCPPMSIEAGDKTPEVIAWYKKYKPEEFATKYKGRRFTIEA